MAFGPTLRHLRLDANLTQRELGEKAGIHFAYLSKIEAELVPSPSDEKLLALADALNLKGAERQSFFDLAEQAKVPTDLAKEAVVKHPEIGALLRRVKRNPLTQEELEALRRIADRGRSPEEKPGDEVDPSGA